MDEICIGRFRNVEARSHTDIFFSFRHIYVNLLYLYLHICIFFSLFFSKSKIYNVWRIFVSWNGCSSQPNVADLFVVNKKKRKERKQKREKTQYTDDYFDPHFVAAIKNLLTWLRTLSIYIPFAKTTFDLISGNGNGCGGDGGLEVVAACLPTSLPA